ncbi:MAG: fumarylacetoacetate hydrolase family protein, partial [Sterolibacterium sp.]
MKLATLKEGGRDGILVVVSRDLRLCQAVPDIAATLQAALDRWDDLLPQLQAVSLSLDSGAARHARPFDPRACHSPLPRAYQWADGSAYVNHIELVRRARGDTMPPEFWTDPLMYQGGSDSFVGPCDAIMAKSEAWGIDLEGEVAVITGDVPMGAAAEDAAQRIRLV